MSLVGEYMKSLSDAVLMECIQDYEKYSKDGFIGECTLRKVAEDVCKIVNNNNIIIWMEEVAKESYKRFARYYLDSLSKG